jgi:hypothetical protein
MEDPDSALRRGSDEYTGLTKYWVGRALVDDWQDLADIVGIPVADRERFQRGREPQSIWDWLEARKRLSELRPAFETMKRDDLVALLDNDPIAK